MPLGRLQRASVLAERMAAWAASTEVVKPNDLFKCEIYPSSIATELTGSDAPVDKIDVVVDSLRNPDDCDVQLPCNALFRERVGSAVSSIACLSQKRH